MLYSSFYSVEAVFVREVDYNTRIVLNERELVASYPFGGIGYVTLRIFRGVSKK